MRFPRIIVLATWLVAAPTLAVAADKPIPQDPARMGQRSKNWLAWNRLTLGDAYEKVGKRDPKWDKPAREACDLAARGYSLQSDPLVTFDDIFQAARRAVDAGCDDPLILYLYAQSSMIPNFPGDDEFFRRAQRAADALMVSSYSPFRKASALLKATQLRMRQADQPPTPEQARTIAAGLDGIFDLLAQSVKVDPRGEFWEARWYDSLESVLTASQRLSTDAKATYDQFDAKLAKIPGIEAMRLTLKGSFFTDWAWIARTVKFAPLVTEKQFDLFHERLIEARRAIEAAYQLNPNQPKMAQLMLQIQVGIGTDDDRDTMELWFERAMEQDPNDRTACLIKLDWLEPKWHGDPSGNEMLAFGKACAATKNWQNGIILLSADSILRHYAAMPKATRNQYLFQAENWTAIQTVHDEYLKHYPDDFGALTKYAFLAYWAGRVDVAHTLFERIGENITPWTESCTVDIEHIREVRARAAKFMAEHRAKKQTGPPK